MLTKQPSLARSLTLLTILFLAAQLSFFLITITTSGIVHVLIKNSITFEVLTASIVIKPLIAFLLTHLILYCVFIFFVWYLAISIGELFHLTDITTFWADLALWLIATTYLIIANSYFFDLSIFSLANFTPISTKQLRIILYSLAAPILLACIFAFINLISRLYQKTISRHHVIALSLLIIMTASFIPNPISLRSNQPHSKQPNIFIISVEALRPDFITHDTMPFLTTLLSTTVQFTNAYTPIAQSFPAWISMLTSQTPKHHGARSLYTATTDINLHASLITKLKTSGYETYYAVDGQRFGDITEETGFDHIISPPSGAAELVIGSISDFPMLNLTTLTPFRKYVLPYSYANRSISVTYHPADFVNMLNDALHTIHNKPVFFGVHFGLSHWPFRWASDLQTNHLTLAEQYRNSLRAADNQIKQFMRMLRNARLLDSAMVILVSDHGIGLGIPGDRLIAEPMLTGRNNHLDWLEESQYSTQPSYGLDTSYGYSTDILSLVQYHTLLAIKKYGTTTTQGKINTTRASLLDVTPTILDYLKIEPLNFYDGISLINTMKHDTATDDHRILFLENGFTTPEIAKANISATEVLNDAPAIALNQTTGLLYITKQAKQKLLQQKQRAVLMDDWLLARYPHRTRYKLTSQNGSPHSSTKKLTLKSVEIPPHYILVNTTTKRWTMDLASDFAKQAPLPKLMNAFISYNIDEIDNR